MSPQADLPSKIRNWRPASMSLLMHILIVILLMVWFFSSPPNTPPTELRRVGITISVQNDENQPIEYLTRDELLEPQESQPVSPASDPTSTPPPSLATLSRPADRLDLPGFSVGSPRFDANSMSTVPSQSPASRPLVLTEEDLKTMEADQKLFRDRAPQGNPTTIRVFGSGDLTGRSFVFVLDRSQSMGSGGLNVLQSAQNELAAAVDQLEPVHQFQIVGYHDRTVTLSQRRLLNATDANKNLVADFISNLVAFGPTHHENGLMAAVGFKPDIIVLMTDGGHPELNESQMKMIKRLAPKGCQIHCIQFGIGALQQKTNFMTRLANQNHGTFRYIDVTEWNQP